MNNSQCACGEPASPGSHGLTICDRLPDSQRLQKLLQAAAATGTEVAAERDRLRAAVDGALYQLVNFRDTRAGARLGDAIKLLRSALLGGSPPYLRRVLLDRVLEGHVIAALKCLLSADALNCRQAIDILCTALHTTEQECRVKWAEHIIQPKETVPNFVWPECVLGNECPHPGCNLPRWTRHHYHASTPPTPWPGSNPNKAGPEEPLRPSQKVTGDLSGSYRDATGELVLPCDKPSAVHATLDDAWKAFLKNTDSDRSVWEAFQYAWLTRGYLDPTGKQLEAQCQALWRSNMTLVCQLDKGHSGDHRSGRFTWTVTKSPDLQGDV